MNHFKFRAWDVKHKRIEEIEAIYCENNGEIREVATEEYRGCFIREMREEVVLMQSIGIQDKEGNDIFEGDILIISKGDCNYESDYITEVRRFGEVDAKNEDYDFTLLNWLDYSEVEIIGNIYENPELLAIEPKE